jgi:predicted kinase
MTTQPAMLRKGPARLTAKEINLAVYYEAVRRGCTVKVVGDYAWYARNNRNRWVRFIDCRDGSTVTVSFQANRKTAPVRYTVDA